MANYTRGLNLICVPLRKKYRSHIEIVALILEAIKDTGAARYSLMKHTSNNYAQLRKYLELLAKIGFIEMDIKEGKILYRASEMGLDFLRQYNVLRDMLFSAYSRNRPIKIIREECNVSSVQRSLSTPPTPLATRFVKRS